MTYCVFFLLYYKIAIISKIDFLKISHSKTTTCKDNTESLQGESEVTRENCKYYSKYAVRCRWTILHGMVLSNLLTSPVNALLILIFFKRHLCHHDTAVA